MEAKIKIIVEEALNEIKKTNDYENFRELRKCQKKSLWQRLKCFIAPEIASVYGQFFPKIKEIYYGDIRAGVWVAREEGQEDERVTGIDLDLLIIAPNISISTLKEITKKLDSYFIQFLTQDPFAAESLKKNGSFHNFLEIQVNNHFAYQAKRDPSSCGADLIYQKKEK